MAGWRHWVFNAVHALLHPGARASVKLVVERFVWPDLRKEVRNWGAACLACQRAKVPRHTKTPLELFLIPERHFDGMHIDLLGPLPPSHGFNYLLTMVNMTTRWPEVVPLSSVTSAKVALGFFSTWVACFGTPADPTSDRGVQFPSKLWTVVAACLGVQLHWTAAYNPQANGLCERFHRWLDHLPWAMLGLCLAPQKRPAVFGGRTSFYVSNCEILTDASACCHMKVQHLLLWDQAGGFSPVNTHHCLPRSYVGLPPVSDKKL